MTDDPLKPIMPAHDWAKVFCGALDVFRAALCDGRSIAEARRIASPPKHRHLEIRPIRLKEKKNGHDH